MLLAIATDNRCRLAAIRQVLPIAAHLAPAAE
jgi:hypothetical protein